MENKNIENIENIKTIPQLTESIIKGVKILDDELDYLYNYQELLNNHYLSCCVKNPEDKAMYRKIRNKKEMSEIERIKKIFIDVECLIEMYSNLVKSKKAYLSLIDKCNSKNVKFTLNYNKDHNDWNGQDFTIDCDYEKE